MVPLSFKFIEVVEILGKTFNWTGQTRSKVHCTATGSTLRSGPISGNPGLWGEYAGSLFHHHYLTFPQTIVKSSKFSNGDRVTKGDLTLAIEKMG